MKITQIQQTEKVGCTGLVKTTRFIIGTTPQGNGCFGLRKTNMKKTTIEYKLCLICHSTDKKLNSTKCFKCKKDKVNLTDPCWGDGYNYKKA